MGPFGIFWSSAIQLILLSSISASNLSYREEEQKILEDLLKPPYDKRIRPMGDGNRFNDTAGTVVNINMFIRSFDFIDDVNMQYSIQLTFRQKWNDNRLKFAHKNPPVSNEKTAHFHDMLVPNTFIRVFPNGDILWSSRLSMTLSCHMQLRTFPFDEQTCFMRMASYGYTTDDLIFLWEPGNSLELTPHLELPRFSLEKFQTDKCDSVTTTGTYSCLLMKFSMRRDSSYYNSQIFMPCFMLVIVGWLSFWINRYEPTARVVVLIATLLVMATLIGGFTNQVPKVSYTKASDIWTITCFLFIFAAMFQYILVHYLTSCEEAGSGAGGRQEGSVRGTSPENHNLMGASATGGQVEEGKARNRRNPTDVDKMFYEYWTWTWFKEQQIGQQIDLVTRIAYPLAFFIFNLSYWPQYYDTKSTVALSD